MTETEFQPFQPMFEDTKAGLPPPPVHEKKARKKRGPNKVKAAPAVDKPAPKAKKVRKKRVAKVAPAPRALKLDMNLMFEVSSLLKTVTDFAAFSAIVETLQGVNKAARTRILAAVGRVFA